MPTGDRRLTIGLKRLLSRTDLGTRLVDYFEGRIDELVSSMFSGQSGVLDSDAVVLQAGSANNLFDVVVTNANRVVTSSGSVVTIPPNVLGLTKDVPFANANGVLYSVGVRYARPVAQLLQINAATGTPEYPALEDSYGELGAPGSAVDSFGVSLTLVIDNLLQNGVSHAGRHVLVYLATPQGRTVADAFYEGVVTYHSGTGQNRVVMLYSGAVGPLGQDTSVNPPSTTPADYVVHVQGVSWFTEAFKDLRADSAYAFLGRVTGGSPPTFNVDDQQTVFQQSLDRAYDGQLGSGSGRTIIADAGSVRVRNTGTAADTYGATLSVEAVEETADNKVLQQLIGGGRPSSGIMAALMVLSDASDVRKAEGCTFANSDEVVLTRGAASIPASGFLLPGQDLARISSSPTNDGLYLVNARVGATTVELRNLDGTAPTLVTSDNGVVTFLRPQLVVGGQVTTAAVQQGVTITGDNVSSGGAALNIVKGHRPQAVKLYDAAGNVLIDTDADGVRAPKLIVQDPEQGGEDYAWGLKVDNTVAGYDQLILHNKVTPDVVATLRKLTASKLALGLSMQGHSGRDRLGVGETLILGCVDATDTGDDIGLVIKRATGNLEEAYIAAIGEEGVQENLEVYFGNDLSSTQRSVRVKNGPLRANDIKVYDPAATVTTLTIGDATVNNVKAQGQLVELVANDDVNIRGNDDVNITADANVGGAGDVKLVGRAIRQTLTAPITEDIVVPLIGGQPSLGGNGYWSLASLYEGYGLPDGAGCGLVLGWFPHLCTINYIELSVEFSGTPTPNCYFYVQRHTFGNSANTSIHTRSYTGGGSGHRIIRLPASGSLTGMSNLSRGADVVLISVINYSGVFATIFVAARLNVTYDRLLPWPGMA